ncbi:MAG: Flagellin [Bacteriovoracaceae bacterium]|nr:Flagellin [Bacteriovoracaceae bacterium]
MGLRINTNVISLKAQRNLGYSVTALQTAMERLSSGSRINNAGDDAAGLAVSEGLRSQVRGLQQAVRNANDGVGYLATAEGALSQSTNIIQRIRELAIQASTGSISDTDRTNLDNEAQQLISEFDRIATSTEFNGSFLLDGSFSTISLQVGTRKADTIDFSIGNARASALGALATLSGARGQITTGLSGLFINGQAVGTTQAADDALSSAGNSYSAIAIAKNINSVSSKTGVFADVQNTIIQLNNLSFSSFAGDLSADAFKINNTAITGTGINNVAAFITAVNGFSNTTGVQARLQAGATTSIEFFAADGRNIQVAFSANAATTGLWASFEDGLSSNVSAGGISAGLLFSATGVSVGTNIVRTGAIKLRSSAAITLTGASNSGALGFASTAVAVSTSTNLTNVNLRSQQTASDALAVLDSVLTQVINIRAGLGATQNRLDITSVRLGVVNENLSAAQSQIRDADIAVETANLTKNQILQQAGIAVLGQANVSAQAALALLKF